MAIFITGGGTNPVTYTQINYLQSTGSQYINLNYGLKNTSSIELSFQLLNNDSGYMGIFGKRDSYSGTLNGYALFAYQNKFMFINAQAYTWVFEDTSKFNDVHTVKINNNQIIFSDKITSINISSLQNTIQNCGLFCFYTGTIPEFISAMKVYYLNIYDNNVLEKQLVPAVDRKGVFCLYDKINDQFYYNSGSGEFTGG